MGKFCERPFIRVRVTSEGNVFFCCYQTQTPVGNLLRQPLDEIWHSPIAREVRGELRKARLHALCDVLGCPYREGAIDASLAPESDLPYPISLDISLPNTHCNVGGTLPTSETPACIMCERSASGVRWEEDRLDEVLEKLRPCVPHLKHLHVQGVAEPFWKDAIFQVFDKLEIAPSNSIYITTVTNATVLTEKRMEDFLSRCPNSTLCVSIDAACSETYRKIRRLDAFERVTSNVLRFGQMRKPGQSLRIQNNINLLNLGEVVGMVRFASEVGADSLELNPTEGGPKEIILNQENADRFYLAQCAAAVEAHALGLRLEFLRDLDLGTSSLREPG